MRYLNLEFFLFGTAEAYLIHKASAAFSHRATFRQVSVSDLVGSRLDLCREIG